MSNQTHPKSADLITDIVLIHPRVTDAQATSSPKTLSDEVSFQLGLFLETDDQEMILATNLSVTHDDITCSTTMSGRVYGFPFADALSKDDDELSALISTTAAARALYHSASSTLRQLASMVEMSTADLPYLMPEPNVQIIRFSSEDVATKSSTEDDVD
ncbi:hypothetical protein ACNPM8_01795 [Glutamicibacter sp. AGC46]